MTLSKTSNGNTYEQFTSHGRTYDTLAGVAGRLAQLNIDNTIYGESDGRVLESHLILTDLESFASKHGADHPTEAVRMALSNVQYVQNHLLSPVLSVLEEIRIAVQNTNQGRRSGGL